MAIDRIYAQLNCTDLTVSTRWYAMLFGRGTDACPMAELREWHHGDSAGLQLFEKAANAGHGTMTLIVSAIDAEHARLEAGGMSPGAIERGDIITIVQLNDPDGNLIILAEPAREAG